MGCENKITSHLSTAPPTNPPHPRAVNVCHQQIIHSRRFAVYTEFIIFA